MSFSPTRLLAVAAFGSLIMTGMGEAQTAAAEFEPLRQAIFSDGTQGRLARISNGRAFYVIEGGAVRSISTSRLAVMGSRARDFVSTCWRYKSACVAATALTAFAAAYGYYEYQEFLARQDENGAPVGYPSCDSVYPAQRVSIRNGATGAVPVQVRAWTVPCLATNATNQEVWQDGYSTQLAAAADSYTGPSSRDVLDGGTDENGVATAYQTGAMHYYRFNNNSASEVPEVVQPTDEQLAHDLQTEIANGGLTESLLGTEAGADLAHIFEPVNVADPDWQEHPEGLPEPGSDPAQSEPQPVQLTGPVDVTAPPDPVSTFDDLDNDSVDLLGFFDFGQGWLPQQCPTTLFDVEIVGERFAPDVSWICAPLTNWFRPMVLLSAAFSFLGIVFGGIRGM